MRSRGCARCSVIRCSCARPPAWTQRPSRANSPSRCARRLRSSTQRSRTGRASTRRARRGPFASTCRTSGRSNFCRRSSSARRVGGGRRAAPGGRLEAVALEVDDIADALATGALDLAVGFLPGLGPPVRRRALFRDPYLCLMRAEHPIKALTRRKFQEASHALVTYRGGHRVVEEALERAGLARRIALPLPHFTVVPMVLERTDLLCTLPARVARVFEQRGGLKSLAPPVPIPPADVAGHWHGGFEAHR